MRFLDIGVAVMVGVSSMAGLAVWSPRSGDSLANQMALQVQLRDGLVSFLASRGVPWLIDAPAIEVCTVLRSTMARAGGVLVSVGAESCGTPPPAGAVVANLTLRLLPSEVRLVAWSAD